MSLFSLLKIPNLHLFPSSFSFPYSEKRNPALQEYPLPLTDPKPALHFQPFRYGGRVAHGVVPVQGRVAHPYSSWRTSTSHEHEHRSAILLRRHLTHHHNSFLLPHLSATARSSKMPPPGLDKILLRQSRRSSTEFHRIGISKRSKWFTKCATISSLSISATTPLRNVSFRCSSSVQCNLHSSSKIFVKGLPLSTSEGHLMKVFLEFGEVTLVQLPIDKDSGQSLGFAFIWFVKEESAHLAVQEMNGKFFHGRFIYVTIAKPGSSKSSNRTMAYKF